MPDLSKATPRPWRWKYGDSFDHGEDGEANGFEIVLGDAQPESGRCRVVHRIRYAEDIFPEDARAGYAEAEANAQLIVKAVNLHDDLVGALRNLSAEVTGVIDLAESSLREALGNTNVAVLRDRLSEARASLAKAEERR